MVVYNQRWRKEMNKDKVIRKVFMDCPACGHKHFVEERDRQVSWTIHDQIVYSHERYFHCAFAKEYNDWQTMEMEEESSRNGHDAYRKTNGLLSSKDIYNIRLRYRLSQRELEILLDLERDAIARYEKDIVQSIYVDRMLRCIQRNPLELMTLVSLHRNQFSEIRRKEILDRIAEVIFEEKERDKTFRNINPHPTFVDIHAIWN